MATKNAKRTASALVTVRLVWPFLEVARNAGYTDANAETAKLLKLSVAQLRDPETLVPLQLVSELLDAAIRVGGNRDIGLLAAAYVDSAHVGITEYVARSQATLRDAIESTTRYMRLLGDAALQTFEVDGKVATITHWLDPSVRLHPAAYEFAVALGVLRARRITGVADLAPIEVHFTHPEPASLTHHKKLLRCRLRFGMPATKVVMSASFIGMPLAGAEPALNKLLEQQADAQLARLPRSRQLAPRVKALLHAEQSLREASAEAIAGRLGMSVRTLSRKLDAERTSYRELIDDARKQAALRELAQTERTIVEIADALGFASSQSFHRAFRRWTRTTAARYRARSAHHGAKPGRRKKVRGRL